MPKRQGKGFEIICYVLGAIIGFFVFASLKKFLGIAISSMLGIAIMLFCGTLIITLLDRNQKGHP